MQKGICLTVLALVIGLVGLVGGQTQAAIASSTRWVNDNSPNTGGYAPPGTSCKNPGYQTIQSAVDASAPGDTIKVCTGTYAGR